METVLAGTGGCTAYDVVLILKRGPPRRARLQRQVDDGTRRGYRPQGVHQDPYAVHRHGQGHPQPPWSAVATLSHDKYCSASIMLGKTADITTGFEMLEA